jgi:RNA polymerase sigma-70 factor (ECF subfamily)
MHEAPPPPVVMQDSPEREEHQLLRAYAGGDHEAASELVERTYRGVYGQLYRLCGGDVELAADLTQETYRKAWSSLASFNGSARFSTWLFRIAYNTFLNHIRRPRRVVPIEEAPHPAAEGVDSEAAVVWGETAERVRRAVLGLPDVLRLTVAAHYWGELPVREIARMQGITEPAVRKRLKKAMRQLSDALTEVAS